MHLCLILLDQMFQGVVVGAIEEKVFRLLTQRYLQLGYLVVEIGMIVVEVFLKKV